MFEPYNMDDVQHILKQISDKYTNTTICFSFFFSKLYKDCSNKIKCIHLDLCLFVCTNYQRDIHQYHFHNVMVKFTFF